MLALTHVSKEAYESLLRDGKRPLEDLSEEYGAGYPMRMQGILCAMCVHQCNEDAQEFEHIPNNADELYALVEYFGYDEIFEDNEMENIKPKAALLETMLYSMCQAELQDYEERD